MCSWVALLNVHLAFEPAIGYCMFAYLPPAGGRPLLISDAAVNVAPDIDTRVEAACIAEMVAGWASRVRIAILSATNRF